MVNTYRQTISQSSGTISYDPTDADIWLNFSAEENTGAITIPFPPTPYPDQIFGFSTWASIPNITLDTNGIDIAGVISNMLAGGFASWMYDPTSGGECWYRYS